MVSMKRLLNKLIAWLEGKGFTTTEITDCIRYITSD